MTEIDAANSRYDNKEAKRKLLVKLMSPVKKHGLKPLRMDDVARYMDISKATLYKYFESKEEIIESLVELYTAFFNDAMDGRQDDPDYYVQAWLITLEKGIIFANYVSDAFERDLGDTSPALLYKIKQLKYRRRSQLTAFYEKGIEAGVFHTIDPRILIAQDELMFQHLVEPAYLMEHHLTFRSALQEYYKSKKLQVLLPESASRIDEAKWEERLDYLVQKVANSML